MQSLLFWRNHTPLKTKSWLTKVNFRDLINCTVGISSVSLHHTQSHRFVCTTRSSSRKLPHFCAISGASLLSLAVWSGIRREPVIKRRGMALDRGPEPLSKLLMTPRHALCLSLGRHNGTNVSASLKMYREMTQLGPHLFCMSHTAGRIWAFTWKIEWPAAEWVEETTFGGTDNVSLISKWDSSLFMRTNSNKLNT